MPTKGNVRRITSKTPYNKSNKAAKKGKHERAKKRRISQAVQRETPLRSRFPFRLILLWRRVLVWRSEATPLVYDKHTP